MMKRLNRLCLLLLLLALSPVHGEELLKGTVVKYQILEPNLAPYVSRMVVTQHWLRMDDDEDSGNYLRLSRDSGLIESVNHGDRSIFEIRPKDVSARAPFALEQKTEKLSLSGVPAISGIIPQQFQLSVNNEHCQSVISADGLLPEVIAAWRQFRHVLAGEHAATLANIPADQQQGCDLALNIFAPDWLLNYGLPVQILEVGGKGMLLMDFYLDQQLDPALFTLPEGYHRYSTE
jgi:hypothetical protein